MAAASPTESGAPLAVVTVNLIDFLSEDAFFRVRYLMTTVCCEGVRMVSALSPFTATCSPSTNRRYCSNPSTAIVALVRWVLDTQKEARWSASCLSARSWAALTSLPLFNKVKDSGESSSCLRSNASPLMFTLSAIQGCATA